MASDIPNLTTRWESVRESIRVPTRWESIRESIRVRNRWESIRESIRVRNGDVNYADDEEDESETESSSSTRTQDQVFQSKKTTIKIIVWFVKLLLFGVVLTCLVLSKLTIIKIIADLHVLSNFSMYIVPDDNSTHSSTSDNSLMRAANLYWMLFFIVMIPNLIAWIRAIFNGLLTKSPSHPWPKRSAIFGGILNAGMEAIAESLLLFYVFITLPPEITVILMCGAFSTQTLVQAVSNLCYYCKRGNQNHSPSHDYVSDEQLNSTLQFGMRRRCFRSFIRISSSLYQIIGLGFVTAFLVLEYRNTEQNRVFGLILAVPCLLILSFTWTTRIQKLTFFPSKVSIKRAIKKISRQVSDPENFDETTITARWKASFIATSVRLLVYPVASYIIFRFMYHLQTNEVVDPLGIDIDTPLTISQAFNWNSFYKAVFSVHVVTSFLAYILSWLACYMTLHVFGLGLPILLATPVTLAVYFISTSSSPILNNIILFPFQVEDMSLIDWEVTIVSKWYRLALGCSFFLWGGQQLASGFNVYRAKNAILASDENMFVRPYYNSALLEQYLAINRDVSHQAQVRKDGSREPCQVFICSTMFRENFTEMRQMLRSINRVAKYYKHQIDLNRVHDIFESHIFFDGGCREDELSSFAIQLMSLVHETLDVELTHTKKQKTPYGYRFTWTLQDCMPFVVHLKDNLKVRNKKRWSQVMYMNYVLNHRSDRDGLNLNNTFILTTDADIDFQAESAVVLLDMLARDPQVGAVCSRTHPLGSGPIYWYQIFDYAVGHWLQKSAEHILGSVLCCPGCFSIFRCSALQDCLPTYSSEVNNALEFLMKDMGEDRWLCTLLVENGWRLEYCAISNDYTYCPVEFEEFFKQRRRWIPSTVANLWLLISKATKITANNEAISWFFIIYEFLIIISTIISPATVILIIASGLSAAFGVNGISVVVVLFIFSVFYGIICVFSSQKTQLDVAKILTFMSSVVMAVVIVGILKEAIENIILVAQERASAGNMPSNESVSNSSNPLNFSLSENTIYLTQFGLVFITTAALHIYESFALFHCLWYLLGLPSGYLLLLIYSVANLNSRSWGTREASVTTQSLFSTIWETSKKFIINCLERRKLMEKNQIEKSEEEVTINVDEAHQKPEQAPMSFNVPLNQDIPTYTGTEYPWLMNWLKSVQSEQFYDLFAKEGYTEEWYVSGMTKKELADIGVKPTGYIRHLDKAIKKIPQTLIQVGLPKCIESWIIDLKMDTKEDRYIDKFHEAGYYGESDVENLKNITPEELKNDIGIYKKAHIKRLMQGINQLKIRNEDEERIAEAQLVLTNENPNSQLEENETAFWLHTIECVLKPTPDSFTRANELRDDLNHLRNHAIIAMLLINLVWLILIAVFTFDDLGRVGLSTRLLGLLFLVVYGILLSVQFLGMLLHRLVTLAHYIARLNQALPIEMALVDEIVIANDNV